VYFIWLHGAFNFLEYKEIDVVLQKISVMHWALVFIGRIQGYEKCRDLYVKNILGPLNAAGHTWDVYLSHNGRKKTDPVEKFAEEYDVRCWDQAEFNVEGVRPLVRLPTETGIFNYNALYMYYHMRRVLRLVQDSGTHYDAILYLRADIFYDTPFNYAEHLEKNTLYCPDLRDCGSFNDQTFYGDVDTMTRIFSVYDVVSEYDASGIPVLHAAITLHHHMVKLGITRIEFPLPYRFEENRRVGNWDWYALPPHLQHLSHLAHHFVKK
jgi:hypothetical protein